MEYDEIQKIYVSICQGYEKINELNLSLYFKHPGYFEKFELKKVYDEGLDIAKTNGVKLESEYLDFYIQKNWWSKDKEDQIRTIKAFIENLNKSKQKLLLPSQKEEIQKTIDSESKNLYLLLAERRSIIPTTAEEYAEKYYNRYYLKNLLFKNQEMTSLAFENESMIDEVDDDVYDKIWLKIYKNINLLKIENIKIVAATAFFQNLILLTGADYPIYNFYGKPIVDLTSYQIDLFSYACSYRRIINNTTEKIPDEVLNTPEKLVDWCENSNSSSSKTKKIIDRTPNQKNTRGERSGRITSMVGAKKSDYKEIGMNSDVSNVDLLGEALNKGGELNIYDAIKKTDANASK